MRLLNFLLVMQSNRVVSRIHQSVERYTSAALLVVPLSAYLIVSLTGCGKSEASMALSGKTLFQRHCAICHSPAGLEDVAPTLNGILGRKAGSDAFDYSPILTNSPLIWTADALDQFLEKPREFLPGNRMGFFGIANKKDRKDLVAYLARL